MNQDLIKQIREQTEHLASIERMGLMPDLEAIAADTLGKEIARELLRERDPEISDEDVERLFFQCKGNPWDTPILYDMIKNAGEKP